MPQRSPRPPPGAVIPGTASRTPHLVVAMTQIYGSERARRTISKGKRLLGQSLDEPARVSKRPLPGESRSSELEPHTQPPCAGNSRDVNPVSLSQVQRRQTNKQNKTVKQKHEREFMLHRNELLSSENASNLAVWVPAGLTTMSKHIRDLDQNSAGTETEKGESRGAIAGRGGRRAQYSGGPPAVRAAGRRPCRWDRGSRLWVPVLLFEVWFLLGGPLPTAANGRSSPSPCASPARPSPPVYPRLPQHHHSCRLPPTDASYAPRPARRGSSEPNAYHAAAQPCLSPFRGFGLKAKLPMMALEGPALLAPASRHIAPDADPYTPALLILHPPAPYPPAWSVP